MRHERRPLDADLLALVNPNATEPLGDLVSCLQSGGKLTEAQRDLILDAIRRHAERRNASLTKSRQRPGREVGGPRRRSAGRNNGTIGARWYGSCQRLAHIEQTFLKNRAKGA